MTPQNRIEEIIKARQDYVNLLRTSDKPQGRYFFLRQGAYCAIGLWYGDNVPANDSAEFMDKLGLDLMAACKITHWNDSRFMSFREIANAFEEANFPIVVKPLG